MIIIVVIWLLKIFVKFVFLVLFICAFKKDQVSLPAPV